MAIAPALADLSFVTSTLQLLVAQVVGNPGGQELGKASLIGSFIGRPRQKATPEGLSGGSGERHPDQNQALCGSIGCRNVDRAIFLLCTVLQLHN
jgi:hypothetical protein